MKNNKGFTLVELMAVIVVLAIIISIAIPSAISISRKVKENMYETKVDMIISSAKIYGQDHPGNVGNSEGECSLISIQTLIDEGYIKKDKDGYVQNPIDNSSMNNLQVCIYKNNNRFYAKFSDDSGEETEPIAQKYYAFGLPNTTSPTNYNNVITSSGSNAFVQLEGEQLSACIYRNNTLECFKNNNYEAELKHLKQVFGESSCSVNNYGVLCSVADFYCTAYLSGTVFCRDYVTSHYCSVYASGSVGCS